MTKSTGAAVNARIVYWGVPGAGISSSLHHICTKLRPDHRGELQELPTRVDPTVSYEVLPIKLGEVGGVDTRIEIVAVPGAAEHAPTRKQLLDRADGVVFVVDARAERVDECVERFEELRRALAAYGRALDTLPLVIQVNKRDLADPAGLEALARKLDARGAPSFETVATDGTGVLQVLSTISKRVVRSLRDQPGRVLAATPASTATARSASTASTAPAPARSLRAAASTSPTSEEWPAPLPRRRAPEAPDRSVAPSPTSAASALHDVTGRLESRPSSASREAAAVQVPLPAALRIVSVGTATRDGESNVRLPLELEDESGRRFQLTLTLALGAGLADRE